VPHPLDTLQQTAARRGLAIQHLAPGEQLLLTD